MIQCCQTRTEVYYLMQIEGSDVLYTAHDKTEIHCDVLKLSVQKKADRSNIVKLVAPKGAQMLFNFISVGPRMVMRSALKLLRANIITRLISVLVLLSIDTVSLVRKRISWKQFLINVALAATLLIGGTWGWNLGGSAAGVIGGILLENMVLGLLISMVGAGLVSGVMGSFVERFIGRFISTDTQDMLKICNEVFVELAEKNQLSETEIETIKESIEITKPVLQNMFIQEDRAEFAKSLIEPCVKSVTCNRCDIYEDITPIGFSSL